MDDQDMELSSLKKEAAQLATPWNIPTATPGRFCNNELDFCPSPAALLCSRCKFFKYCSAACQKRMWPSHKKHCKAYPQSPIHEIVSSDPNDENHFNADPENAKSLDRPNIFIDIQNEEDPLEGNALSFVDLRLQKQFVLYKLRCSFFGVARYPKTVIITEHREIADDLLDFIRDSTFEDFTEWSEVQDWFRVVHEDTPTAERERVMREWEKIDSEIRVVITAPLGELDFIVKDVETVVVLSAEGPRAMEKRWQRMARMEGQKGYYLQVVKVWEGLEAGDEYEEWGELGCRRETALELIAGGASVSS